MGQMIDFKLHLKPLSLTPFMVRLDLISSVPSLEFKGGALAYCPQIEAAGTCNNSSLYQD